MNANASQPAVGRRPPRVVLDKNTLIGSAYAAESASRQIVEACLKGAVVAVLSPALRRECARIVERAVRVPGQGEALRRLLERAELVEPAETPRVVPDDPDDDKVVAAAVAAGADAVVTNDHHLLALDPYGPLRLLRPAEFVRLWLAG